MTDTSTAAIAALMDGVTPGEVRACNMVHADRGDQMTAEEVGEYVAGCVRLGDPTRFLFLAGKNDHGDDIDVCHIGNGPRGPANARFLAACFELVPALAAERDALRAENGRLRAAPPEVTALVEAATALRDQIARWHEGGPAAGPDESRSLFGALDDALTAWEAAQK